MSGNYSTPYIFMRVWIRPAPSRTEGNTISMRVSPAATNPANQTYHPTDVTVLLLLATAMSRYTPALSTNTLQPPSNAHLPSLHCVYMIAPIVCFQFSECSFSSHSVIPTRDTAGGLANGKWFSTVVRCNTAIAQFRTGKVIIDLLMFCNQII